MRNLQANPHTELKHQRQTPSQTTPTLRRRWSFFDFLPPTTDRMPPQTRQDRHILLILSQRGPCQLVL